MDSKTTLSEECTTPINESFIYILFQKIIITQHENTAPLNCKSKIIYKDEKNIITCDTYTELFNDIYAIKDINNPNRFFVAFCYEVSPYNAYIHGLIIYFNSFENKINMGNVFEYDPRNEQPSNKNTFLCNQTLMMSLLQRNTRQYINQYLCLSYNDGVCGYYIDHSEIDGKRTGIVNDRFLNFIYKNNDNKYIDLLSINVSMIEKERIFNFDTYNEIPNNIVDVSFYYNDGYPYHCIKCKRLTCFSAVKSKQDGYSLGNSLCDKCMIRYSKTDKKWICCKLKTPIMTSARDFINMCNNTIDDENNECCDNHDETIKFEIKETDYVYFRYPFKTQKNIIIE